eukprot:3266921-Pyramimonas_sp.AAC.1
MIWASGMVENRADALATGTTTLTLHTTCNRHRQPAEMVLRPPPQSKSWRMLRRRWRRVDDPTPPRPEESSSPPRLISSPPLHQESQEGQ